MPYPTGPPTLITYKTCHWGETAATDHMVFTALIFLAPKPTRCFFSNRATSSRIIASQSGILTTKLSRWEHAGSVSKLYSQSPPISETLNREQWLGSFYSSQKIRCYIGIHVNQCACSAPGIHRELLPCSRLEPPSPWKTPFLSPQPWALTQPVFCLFTRKATSLLTPSRGMSVFLPTRDLNSVGRVTCPGCNQETWALLTTGNSRRRFSWPLWGQLDPPFHTPL